MISECAREHRAPVSRASSTSKFVYIDIKVVYGVDLAISNCVYDSFAEISLFVPVHIEHYLPFSVNTFYHKRFMFIL